MKVFADEGVDQQIVTALRGAGLDVTYAAEISPAVADSDLLSRAVGKGRLLITSDKDFGELVFRLGKASHGVLLARLAGLSPEAKARAVAEAFATRGSELQFAFSVLSPGQLRVRKPLHRR